jgi:ETC complex I subunit conserved region.
MRAKIYRPAKSAMTSGMANTRLWILEYTPEARKHIDPLMGWTGSRDTAEQVRMRFETREAAVDYAKRHGIAYQVVEPKPRGRNVRPRGYGGNFATDRRTPWTH